MELDNYKFSVTLKNLLTGDREVAKIFTQSKHKQDILKVVYSTYSDIMFVEAIHLEWQDCF